jgi:hypothetical protein
MTQHPDHKPGMSRLEHAMSRLPPSIEVTAQHVARLQLQRLDIMSSWLPALVLRIMSSKATAPQELAEANMQLAQAPVKAPLPHVANSCQGFEWLCACTCSSQQQASS